MNNCRRHIIFLILCATCVMPQMAQPMITALQYGPQQSRRAVKSGESLSMPFFDDFSNYVGSPSAKRWEPSAAWVSGGVQPLPPTVGIVTLDAFSAAGLLYSQTASAERFPADTLTSLPILLDSLRVPVARRLTIGDSVALSFYFMPGGGKGDLWTRSGDAPDAGDSLVLEFYDGTVWSVVWSTDGMDVDSARRASGRDWTYVYVPITNPRYLTADFRFRFRNYCSFDNVEISGIVGNCDQWHIDYVYLDYNRRADYYYTRDVAFVKPASSMLRKYQAMPARQFRASEMATNVDVLITNRYVQELSCRYSYSETDDFLRAYNGGIDNIVAYFPDGDYQTSEAHTHPPISSAYPTDGVQRVYKITHVVTEGVGGDPFPQNDTLHFYQHLEDYYAYDDGSAENGYGIYNSNGKARMAMRFVINQADTLRSVAMSFCRTRGGENEQMVFRLCVWADNNGEPGALLYKDEALRRPLFNGLDGFVQYELESLLPIEGTIYVGFEQSTTGLIHLGMDRANDASEHLYYNVDAGWQQSFLAGAPMLRPYLGQPTATSIETAEYHHITVYPNPARQWVVIEGSDADAQVSLYSMQGAVLRNENSNRLYVGDLPSGIYMLRVMHHSQTAYRRVVVAH